MTDTETFRQKVIDAGIRGKLTKQLPKDGNAEDLYQQIQEEKAKLVKEGKIKKSKPLPEIKPEEIPFEIPKNWKWVRLGDVLHVEMGQSPAGTSISEDAHGIEFHQGKLCFGDKYIKKSSVYTSAPTKIVIPNSVLLCVRAPVGKVNISTRKICIGRGLCAITSVCNFDVDYLFYVLLAFEGVFKKKSSGTTFSSISANVVNNQLIPFAPFEEQKRIAGKIDAILDTQRHLAQSLEEYSANVEALKSKVIDAGIKGKLTVQRPDDGNAEDLYTQIQFEKNRLVNEGKVKKSKPLPPIKSEEIPFEIPKNWKWVRLGEIFDHNTGKALNSSNKVGSLLTYITTSNVYWDHFELEGLKSMYFTDDELEKCTVQKGDLLICEGGDIGRSAIWSFDEKIRIQNHLHRLRPFKKGIISKYYYYLMWNYKQNGLIDGRGIGLQGFSSKRVHSLIVPLPPIAEQERIVQKIDSIISSI